MFGSNKKEEKEDQETTTSCPTPSRKILNWNHLTTFENQIVRPGIDPESILEPLIIQAWMLGRDVEVYAAKTDNWKAPDHLMSVGIVSSVTVDGPYVDRAEPLEHDTPDFISISGFANKEDAYAGLPFYLKYNMELSPMIKRYLDALYTYQVHAELSKGHSFTPNIGLGMFGPWVSMSWNQK